MRYVGLILVIAAAYSTTTFPEIAHAAFWSGWFGKQDLVTKLKPEVALLKAPTNTNPSAGRGGASINVEDGVALVSEVGPELSSVDYQDGVVTDQISVYTVRDGDTLSSIANMFGVSSNTILWANDIKRGSALKPGSTLTILPVSGVRYTVKRGDTVAALAKKYKADEEDILSFNEVSGALTVGDVIMIPHGTQPEAETPKKKSSTSKIALKKPVGSSGGAVGSFLRPLLGGIKTQGIHGYNAVDFGTAMGSSVIAAASGEVVISKGGGWNGGYGTYIVIKHANGVQTLYAHLSETAVGVGASVAAGDVIGYSGNTGRSTGPHLHFEVRGATNPF